MMPALSGRMPAIDLRSDTVTRPTAEMLDFIATAPVGDDLFGEDPTCNDLEREVAQILGKEAALFTPSGTMANQIAINLHTRPGDSILAEENTHCFLYEAGGAAALSGVQFDFVPTGDELQPAAILSRLRQDNVNSSPSTLMVVENTHNKAGGRVLTVDQVTAAASTARNAGVKVHCDGARLWNAAAYLRCPEQDLARPFDSVAVCFSKGLGAPVGSALCGTVEFVARARKIRKRWGAGMRQAGVIAAGALFALRHHRARLAEDHRRLLYLRDALCRAAASGKHIEVMNVQRPTNLLYFRVGSPVADALSLGWAGDAYSAKLADQGVLMFHLGGGWLRAVTHLHISDADIERAAEILVRNG